MRRICEYCSDKETCSYLKHGHESKCLGVQDYDLGYEEAIDNICEWLKDSLFAFVEYDLLNGINIDYCHLNKQLRKAMEERQ